MNQGKLELVKQKTEKMNIDTLGVGKLNWTGMRELNSDEHDIYYCGKESLKRNEVALIANKRVQNAILGAVSKLTECSLCFQGKPFNITVIHVYAPTTDAKEVKLISSKKT